MDFIYSLFLVIGFAILLWWYIRILLAKKRKEKSIKQNKTRYNRYGIDEEGNYNRLYDRAAFKYNVYSKEGFLNPKNYPVGITDHARQRMSERLGLESYTAMDRFALLAYQYGKSSLQVPKTAAAKIREIENRYNDEKIVLLYRSVVCIFSNDNALITVYNNTDIVI